MFTEDAAGRAQLLIQGSIEGDREHSQKLNKTYFPSGAVWALDCNALRERRRIYCEPLRMVMMEYERSIDVDDETDWMIAELLAQRNGFTLLDAAPARSAQ
jgi:CMP-N-acetylneuraminic acid synthetase